MAVSFASRSLHTLIRLIRVKSWANPPVLNFFIRMSRKSGAAQPSGRLRSLCHVEPRKDHGDRVFRLTPRKGGEAPFHLFYVHGGAYSIDIGFVHWQIIENLIRLTGCTARVPLYPLAPEHGHEEALASALAHYRDLCMQVPPERIVVMGDSAGGGLSLALAQALGPAGLPQPGHIVLLSPWLDLTMSDPATLAQEAHDPVIKAEAALAAARMYAGDLPLEDPRVSPVYGDVRGLAPVTLLTGTRDLLYPDARRLAERMQAEGQAVELWEYPDMVHAWMLLPLPEAFEARERVAAMLMGKFGRGRSEVETDDRSVRDASGSRR
jgi:acetyl esterase/lipase